jgi:hypothetical protein
MLQSMNVYVRVYVTEYECLYEWICYDVSVYMSVCVAGAECGAGWGECSRDGLPAVAASARLSRPCSHNPRTRMSLHRHGNCTDLAQCCNMFIRSLLYCHSLISCHLLTSVCPNQG